MNMGGRKWKTRLNVLAAGLFIGFLLLIFLSPASASSGEEATKGWVATDTYRVINFAVLAAVLYWILRKPVSQALQGRITGIRDELSELEAKKREAEAKLKEYENQLALLDQEGERIVESYIAQGKEAQARIIAEARVSAEKLEAGARRQIENAFERARVEIQETVLEKALEKAEAAIKAGISAQDQERLVDEYLDKVTAS
jgi:F-type H+-transporting ATPase subunit b